MELKLVRLRHNVKGPLIDPMVREPWTIGESKTIDSKVGHKLLAKYPDYFKEVEKKDPLADLKRAEPVSKDKMFRKAKDK